MGVRLFVWKSAYLRWCRKILMLSIFGDAVLQRLLFWDSPRETTFSRHPKTKTSPVGEVETYQRIARTEK